ncbi:MAG TPA: glycosyltransferase family 39 protein, partial [Ktedonobacteraceae bacterium]
MIVRVKNLKIGIYGLCAFGIIAFAALLRLVLTILGWPLTNSDEATMGLMALHIAFKGEHPFFFYGQNYMGAIEAYLGAAAFRLFGVSLLSLRLSTILLFTLFLICMYFLASLLYNKKVALVTIILLALGSSIMLDTEVIALGGYPELLLFGALALLLASWLALSNSRNLTRRKQVVRYIVYGCWGLVASV